jgi:hypothetical protein
VPDDRAADVLASVWRADGIQASAAKVYAHVCEQFVGISHADCAAFVARQTAKQLVGSSSVVDKIIAPSLPQAVNWRWESDLTFLDSTVPSGEYIGMSVVVDSLSRYCWATPILSKSAAFLAADHERLFKQFGAPQRLQMDSSLENKSTSMRLVCQRYDVTLVHTKPHVSSQQGGVERLHHTLKQKLRTAVIDLSKAGTRTDFPVLLEAIVASYNNSQHSVTQITPFECYFGRPGRLPDAVLIRGDGPAPYAAWAQVQAERGPSQASRW